MSPSLTAHVIVPVGSYPDTTDVQLADEPTAKAAGEQLTDMLAAALSAVRTTVAEPFSTFESPEYVAVTAAEAACWVSIVTLQLPFEDRLQAWSLNGPRPMLPHPMEPVGLTGALTAAVHSAGKPTRTGLGKQLRKTVEAYRICRDSSPWLAKFRESPEYRAVTPTDPGASPKTLTEHSPWAREHPAGSMLTDPFPFAVHATLPPGLDPATVEVHCTAEPTAINVDEQVRESSVGTLVGTGAGGLPKAISVPFSA